MGDDGKRPNKKIIVVGDWYIDENWVISKQKLKFSSHPGDLHYKVIGDLLDGPQGSSNCRQIMSLCGAPEILKVLRQYFANREPDYYEFVGVGVWHPDDDSAMPRILTELGMSDNPYALDRFKKARQGRKRTRKDISLINLGESDDKNARFSTNRVVRCYEGFGGGKPHLLYRFDWILPIKSTDALCYKGLEEIERNNIEAIVIEDHGLGVLNDKSIECLSEKATKDTKWFIRTKVEKPSWFGILRKNNEKGKIGQIMMVSDFHMANHLKGERRWFFKSQLARASLELLGELTGVHTFEHGRPKRHPGSLAADRAAVLLNDNTVIAKEKNNCIGIHKPPGERQVLNVGRTTIFHAMLVAQMLEQKLKSASNRVEAPYYLALKCAYQWSIKVSDFWNTKGDFFYGDYKEIVNILADSRQDSSDRGLKDEIVHHVTAGDYMELWKYWNNSSKKIGTIDQGKGKEIQLWRGEGVLPNYVCVGSEKRDAINQLVSEVAKFSQEPSPKLPLSCVITASPGWGKSFLANCLAKYFQMEYLEFSIAQMATSRDLVNCFATIASVQNRTKNKAIVFIDEINAQIEGNDIINLLLGPLWDGNFLLDGRSYRLDPAVWIFASTDPLAEIIRKNQNKGSDFVSRLNGPVLELDRLGAGPKLYKIIENIKAAANEVLKEPGGRNASAWRRKLVKLYKNQYLRITDAPLRTEQVYLMIKLLISQWGPIHRVERSVMELFQKILPMNGVRSLEFFAANFVEIKEGVITEENIPRIEPGHALERHIIVPARWRKRRSVEERNPDFVTIETVG